MTSDLSQLSVRLAEASDKAALRAAVVELHEAERGLHDSRLPGEETADAYLAWMLAAAARDGAVFVAEAGGVFAGFAAGWIVQDEYIEETPELEPFRLYFRCLRAARVSRASHRRSTCRSA